MAVFTKAHGQGIKDVRINEILVKNQMNCIDNYGVKSGWFEVFNIGYSTVDLGGCYVTNDIANPTKYRISKGNPNTKIAPRAYALFYAYQNSDRGVFHVNFSLDEKGFLAIFDQSGKVLIDSVSYDISVQKPDISFGKMENISHPEAQWVDIPNPTPEAMNYTTVEKTRAEKYSQADSTGIIITLTAMSVVFGLLTILAVVFIFIGRYFRKRVAGEGTKNIRTEEQKTVCPTAADTSDEMDDDLPAIAMALHLYFNEQHEDESTGFYLNRGLNFRNPWSDKHQLFKKSPIRIS
jgi:Na+-transporting methylmalonyl-CoA/oxaloacetate decarboxylase gamma subunit